MLKMNNQEEGTTQLTPTGATKRGSIRPGMRVSIVVKADQSSGKTTAGVVKDILTNSPTHPHGIKVRLQSGQVGRVKQIATAESKGQSAAGK